MDWLYAEVVLDHCSCHAFLETANEDSAGEFFLLLILVVGVGWGSSDTRREGGGCAEGWGRHGGVAESRGHQVGHRSWEGWRVGVQLFHGFYLLKLIISRLFLRDYQPLNIILLKLSYKLHLNKLNHSINSRFRQHALYIY